MKKNNSNQQFFKKSSYWSGRVFYRILVNGKHNGFEEVIQAFHCEGKDDPFEQLERIAKEKEATYTNKDGELIEITLFKVGSIYAIHKQNDNESFEVYSNTFPATEEELDEYLRISYFLDDEDRDLVVLEGARIDKSRR